MPQKSWHTENATGNWRVEEPADYPGIIRIGIPILIIAGLVGNVTALFVLCRKRLIKSAATVFLIPLVAVDVVVLCTVALPFWLIQLVGDVIFKSNVICKIHRSLMFITRDLSAWLLVAIAVSRVIATKWPLRYKPGFTRQRACATVISISVLALLVNGHFLVGYAWTVASSRNGTVADGCVPILDYEEFLRLWPIISVLKTTIIPTVIMFVGSMVIICTLFRHWNDSIAQSRSGGGRNSTSMSLLLLGLNTVHICCTLPIGVYLLTSHELYKFSAVYIISLKDPVLEVLVLLSYLNHVVNIFLYCFTGTLFRSELKAMLTACKNQLGGQ